MMHLIQAATYTAYKLFSNIYQKFKNSKHFFISICENFVKLILKFDICLI